MDIFSRREFINRSALIAAAAAAGSTAVAAEKPAPVKAQGDKLRVAVVGRPSHEVKHLLVSARSFRRHGIESRRPSDDTPLAQGRATMRQ